ncbi:aminopeptidase [Oceanobacillus sp. J11TS1]|uniref:aminopeptidase n=1 Tax=Oceanobacillus sp. J11TS1 TaxID=2807191 RepID=UPI001B0DE62E|nr:aminopeptidase [Oceanobacillus sp. J11TS1]GIO22719.1 aminopeptidase [Oceanobacillus sp. J11TS1]
MALENFDQLLEKYAELIVSTGVNVQKGHSVVLTIDVDQAPLARKITKAAYEKGAKRVIVKWGDDKVSRLGFEYQSAETLTDIPDYRIEEMNYIIEQGASRINVVSNDPDAFKGLDGEKIAATQKAAGEAFEPLAQATQSNKISWVVVAAASQEWAAKVFPELHSVEEQIDALWDAIFKSVHLYDEDAITTWSEKDKTLETKAETLNKEQFVALHYTAPGTDLTVGLPKNHRWEGAGSFNSRGERFIANMPTEEVFTAPDANRVDGVVVSTKPLSYAGSVIEGMEFHFENGKVTKVTAEKGEEVIQKLIQQDEGASRLGEVALVPDASPISQSGLTFFNTLFDENASNHLALGSAYAFNLNGGTEMTEEELKEAGLNRSTTHVDFMIGSNQMDIDGIKQDGSRVPIFRKGAWA